MARTFLPPGTNSALAKLGSSYRMNEDVLQDPWTELQQPPTVQQAPAPVTVNVQTSAPAAPGQTAPAPQQAGAPAALPLSPVPQEPAVQPVVEQPIPQNVGSPEASRAADIGVQDLSGKSIHDLKYMPFNEGQGTSDRIGAGGDIDVGMHKDAAQAAQQKSDYAATHRKALESYFDESHRNEGDQMGRARQLTNEMFDANRKGPPQPSTLQKVLGIVAAVASMGNGENAKGAAHGMGMLTGLMGNDLEKWKVQQASNANTLGALHGQMGAEQSSRNGHYADAAHLMLLHGAEIDNALEASKELNLGKKADLTRQQLQQDWRDKMATSLAAMKTADQKTALGKGLKAQDTELYQKLMEAEGNPAEQVRLASVLGKRGHDVLQDYLKSRGTQVQQGQQEANAEFARTKNADEHAKALREANAVKAPKSEYEQKTYTMLKGLAGENGAIAGLERVLLNPDGTPKNPSDVNLPWAGAETRGGASWLPQMLTPESTRQHDANVNTAKAAYIRMVSGAGVKADEAQNELRDMGVYDRDKNVAARGLQTLLAKLRAGDQFGALDAPGAFNAPAEPALTNAQKAHGVMNRPVVQPAVQGVVNGQPGVVGGTRPPAARWPLQ